MKKKLQVLSFTDSEKCNRTYSIVLISIALIVIIAAVYIQVGNYEFTNYDDPDYVTQNFHVSSGITGKNIIWAFTSVEKNNWHPITWVSHMLDAELFGLNPGLHHLHSLLLHAGSVMLLFLALQRMSRRLWPSART